MSTFRHSIDLPFTPEEVFVAFEDPLRLATWWGPDGFTNSFERFEMSAGGKWVYTMHGPDGKNYANESEFVEIVPNALIRIKHTVLPHYDLTIALESIPSGTHVSWHCVFENVNFAEKMREFLETANEQNLRRLAAVVSGTMH